MIRACPVPAEMPTHRRPGRRHRKGASDMPRNRERTAENVIAAYRRLSEQEQLRVCQILAQDNRTPIHKELETLYTQLCTHKYNYEDAHRAELHLQEKVPDLEER